MTYQEFVNRPRFLRRRISHKIEDVALKEAACTSITASLNERVQTSHSNSIEKSYARYIDAKNELDNMMNELDAVQDEVRNFFYESLSQNEADILEWKYIEDKNSSEIARIIGIANQTVKNKTSKAEKKAKTAWLKKQDR